MGLGLLAVLGAVPSDAPAQQRRPRQGTLRAGQAAPDFTLQDVEGKKTVKLAEARGKPVVLIFGSCT
jgi:cytochrome oxidase Cu insertion factor (SCO1/SenC/PrrC family)